MFLAPPRRGSLIGAVIGKYYTFLPCMCAPIQVQSVLNFPFYLNFISVCLPFHGIKNCFSFPFLSAYTIDISIPYILLSVLPLTTFHCCVQFWKNLCLSTRVFSSRFPCKIAHELGFCKGIPWQFTAPLALFYSLSPSYARIVSFVQGFPCHNLVPHCIPLGSHHLLSSAFLAWINASTDISLHYCSFQTLPFVEVSVVQSPTNQKVWFAL